MNAHALLSSQGWRGNGHSLHKTSDAIGLSKPLLLNRKDGKKGIGATQHFTSDQWWMNAFDEQLQGLDTSKDGKVVQTVQTGKINQFETGSMAKYSLYASFVRGGFLEGTLKGLEDDSTSTTDSDSEAQPTLVAVHSDGDDDSETETKEQRRARKEAKRQRKEERALRRAAKKAKKSKIESSDDKVKQKEARRAKKDEKRRKRQEKDNKASKQ